MSLPHLPVETWHQILRECISIPTFLDPDNLYEVNNPIYTFTTIDNVMREYWAIERHRNGLRRVCKTWNTYLLSFEHRFVRVEDIFHRRVPKEALRNAIRIRFTFCRDWGCRDCRRGIKLEKFSELIQGECELAAKIMDSTHNGEYLRSSIIESHAKIPKLQVILNAHIDGVTSQDWMKTVTSLPELTFVRIIVPTTQAQSLQLQAIKLTSLSYEGDGSPFALILEECDLPSLRHLRFTFRDSIHLGQFDDLIRVLKGIGRNLLSLQLGIFAESTAVVPKEVLELCPRLERLDTSLCLCYPPPPNHPLRTISLSIPFDIIENGREKVVSALPSNLGEWVSLQTVIVDEGWGALQILNRGIIETIKNWKGVCNQHDVALKDWSGVLLEDSEIEAYLDAAVPS